MGKQEIVIIIVGVVLLGYMFLQPYFSDYRDEYRCMMYLPIKNVTCMYMVDGVCYYSCQGNMANFLTIEEIPNQCQRMETNCLERFKIEVLKSVQKNVRD